MFINEIIISMVIAGGVKTGLKKTANHIYWYGSIDVITNKIYKPYVRKNNGTYDYYYNKYGLKAAEDRYKLGTEITDVWITQSVKQAKYPTQKSYKLLKRIICLSTK